jgi:serine/threonine-protein kinase
MGVVHEARHATRSGRFALKALHGSLTGDAVAVERFMREAQALAGLRHPHIVQILDSGIEDGRPFIVMEMLEGESLAALLAREPILPPRRIAELFLPVLSAVATIHDRGIVHRDLKPANIVLARREGVGPTPVLLDFGISRIEGLSPEETDLTHSEALLGTLRYLSPEQLRSAKLASPRSDQYALGVMLYECATGKRPFAGGSHYDLMHAIVTAAVPAPSALVPELPRGFDDVVRRAMSREPGDRFPSARALGSALLTFGDRALWARWGPEFAGVPPDVGTAPAEPTEHDARRGTPRPVPAPVGRRRRRLGTKLAVGALALGCGLVLLGAAGLPIGRRARTATQPIASVQRLPSSAPVTDVSFTHAALIGPPALPATPAQDSSAAGAPRGKAVPVVTGAAGHVRPKTRRTALRGGRTESVPIPSEPRGDDPEKDDVVDPYPVPR